MNINTLNKFGLDENNAKQLFEQIQNYIKSEVENKTLEMKLDYENKLLKISQKAIVEKELMLAGARNIKAVFALLDFDDIETDKFNIQQIKQKISQLKENENTKFLFFQQENQLKLKGFKPFESKTLKEKTTSNMDYEELCQYYENLEQI